MMHTIREGTKPTKSKHLGDWEGEREGEEQGQGRRPWYGAAGPGAIDVDDAVRISPIHGLDIEIIHVGHVAQQAIINTPQRNQQQISYKRNQQHTSLD